MVTAFTFASPKVGNKKFKDDLDDMGVRVLRVVNKPDLVPKVPGAGSFLFALGTSSCAGCCFIYTGHRETPLNIIAGA